jgi:hypothetical protein
MNKALVSIFIFLCTTLFYGTYSQNKEISDTSDLVSILFRNQGALPLQLNYSNRDIKKKTNDSSFIKTNLSYRNDEGIWQEIPIELRRRGNFRLKNCYYAPLKIKIKKSNSKGTLFEGNKKLKLVLPCLTYGNQNDYILKEFIAYRLYEVISNYHFKTRIASISFTELIGNRTKTHSLKGILIEDDKVLAKRSGGDIVERSIHPLNQDATVSVQNAFFQFMIGCTDFSTAYQHNQKLLYHNNSIIPIPYDFDMSGFVNPSYAIVPDESTNLGINSVRERLYRGFKRESSIIQEVRQEFIANKIKLLAIINDFEAEFESSTQYIEAKNYLLEFFEIIEDDAKFQKEITNELRSK